MLAQLLRTAYFFQFIIGMAIGTWCALALQPSWGNAAYVLVVAVALGWIVFWQAVIIGYSMLKSRAAGPVKPWLGAAWGEFLSALWIFGLCQPWVKARPRVRMPTLAATQSHPHAVPVLLVHGFVCNHRVWDKVACAVNKRGHPTLAIDLEPLFTSIDNYAPQIQQAVEDLCHQTGADKVVLVGHSMGGLAIRAWMRAFGSDKVAQIITLGTPHQGTQVLQHFQTPNGQQMAWQSDWVCELTRAETPQTRQLMHLALTEHDNIVYPQLAQTLVGAKLTRFAGMGHLQMCCSDAVVAWLLKQLQRPTAVQATPDSIK